MLPYDRVDDGDDEAHDELEHKDRQIAELTPKGIFADAVNASKKSILVGELAKLLCQNSVQIGQNRLFVWMREHGYLIRDPKRSDYNMPTQRAVEQGLFEIKETTVVHSGPRRPTSTWTYLVTDDPFGSEADRFLTGVRSAVRRRRSGGRP